MRTAGERRFVIRLQQEPDHFADELVRPGRQAQRPRFRRVLLRYVQSPYRVEPVALVAHRIDDAADLAQRKIRPGDLVLVKGSRGVRTDLVVERLKVEFA